MSPSRFMMREFLSSGEKISAVRQLSTPISGLSLYLMTHIPSDSVYSPHAVYSMISLQTEPISD